MLTRQRKQLILEKLGAEGQVQSKALSILFDVSEDTITAAHYRHLPQLLRLPNGNP